MEMRARIPRSTLHRQWRIRSAQRDYPPARFVRAGEGFGAGEVDDSLVCEGLDHTRRPRPRGHDVVRLLRHAGAEVAESWCCRAAISAAGAKLRRVILDKNSRISRAA